MLGVHVHMNTERKGTCLTPERESGLKERKPQMAVCSYCDREMTVANGCAETPIVIGDRAYRAIRFGREPRAPLRLKFRCGDCYVLPGMVHHHGCSAEWCPGCGEQALGCDCVWAGEEHLTEEWLEELEERFLLVGPDE
jgi:hypothetical protein